eukprot:gene23711-54062_t
MRLGEQAQNELRTVQAELARSVGGLGVTNAAQETRAAAELHDANASAPRRGGHWAARVLLRLLEETQRPRACACARILVFGSSAGLMGDGFANTFNWVARALAVAIASRRALVVHGPWRYSPCKPEGWRCVFDGPSTCAYRD